MKTPTTPLFVKTHDFNVWLLNHTRRFPKHFRYTLTNRIETLALEFEEHLVMANSARDQNRSDLLQQADGKLMCLRTHLRYTLDFAILSSGQYRFAAECMDELGRLLGAWFRGTNR